MSKSVCNLVAAALTSALFIGGSAALAEEPSTEKDLSGFTCKDLMRLVTIQDPLSHRVLRA
jgi:hypothetical protein